MPFTNGSSYHRRQVFDSLVKSFVNTRIGTFFDGLQIKWDRVKQFLEQFQFVEQEFLDQLRLNQVQHPEKFQSSTVPSSEIASESTVTNQTDAINDRIYAPLLNSAPEPKKSKKSKKKAVDIGVFSELYKRDISGTFIPQELIQETKLSIEALSNLNNQKAVGDNNDNFNFDILPDMVKAYLGTLKWIMNYYVNQFSFVNVNWCYTFHYAPNIYDLNRYLSLAVTTFVSNTKRTPSWEIEPTLPISDLPTPVEHLLAILPASKLHLLPDVAGDLFKLKMPEMYPDNVHVDWNLVEMSQSGEDINERKTYKVNIPDELHSAIILHDFPSLTRIRDLYHDIEEITEIQYRNATQRIFRKKN
jgi:hypothetical protein